jgi:predicted O-methyltransferase YrrM
MLRKILTPFLSRYHSAIKRIQDLEIVQNTLLFDNIWTKDHSKIMNGQLKRQAIIMELRDAFRFSIIIETGSFIGNTTGWFAELWNGSSVYSCEIDPRFHSLAKMRCSNMGINYFLGDSRSFLKNLPKPESSQTAFIYLDAHWSDDLPLKEELMIIKDKWPRSIVMIDDFEVPGDSGYSYDNYGPGKALTFLEFNSFFLENNFNVYSPKIKSIDESGYKRGMVILTLDPSLRDIIDKVSDLYRH